jgi:hypothetical protein
MAKRNRRVPLCGDELADPLRLIDTALQRYASPRKVPSSEIIDVLRGLRCAIVLDTALASLRADLIGTSTTSSSLRSELRRHPPADDSG